MNWTVKAGALPSELADPSSLQLRPPYFQDIGERMETVCRLIRRGDDFITKTEELLQSKLSLERAIKL